MGLYESLYCGIMLTYLSLINHQWCRWGFFLKLPTEPCALGSTQPPKMSTRILLVVKAAGA
jgi:hypothetical protein